MRDRPDAPPRPRSAQGFTLLEILLAVTIFAMIMTTLFSLLSTGTRTLDRTLARGDMILRARGAMDVLGRDLGSVFFLNESDYNVTARRRLETLEAEAREEEGLDAAERDRRRRDRDDSTSDDEYLLPPEIDLAFVGEEAEPFDRLSFAIASPNEPRGFWAPWGLRRIQYAVSGGVLYRTEDAVFKEDVLADGTVAARPAPEPERVCDKVAYFDVTYSYWSEGSWREAPDWDSGGKKYRFPDIGVSAEELGISEEDLDQQRNSESPDDLPAMVTIRLGIEDQRRAGLVHPFLRRYRLPAAQETQFLPEYRKEWDRRSR